MSSNLILRESTGEIPTNYTRKYAETRGWREWEVIRETVQNSLDATGTVSIEKTTDGLLITDKGRGFNALNLLMGTTTKSKCERGRFGEGMKIAMLAALNMNYQVDIVTDSMHIIPQWKTLEIEEPATGEIVKAEIMVFTYSKIPPVGGTRVSEGYESKAELSSSVMKTAKVEYAWREGFKNFFGNAFLRTGEEQTRLAEYHSHFLKKGVYLPEGIRDPLHNIGIPTDFDILERIKSVLPRYPKSLTPIQQDNFDYIRRIHNVLKEKYFPQLKLVFLASSDTILDSEGKALDNNIYIREDRADTMVHIIDVYGHEATHIAYPELNDNTSDFYSKIGIVMATITKVIVNEKITVPPNVVW
jgi:hypothetical protein